MEFHETFEPDLLLSDGQKLKMGNTAIECVHIPRHTSGAMSYFFTLHDGNKDYTVDIHGGIGLNSLTNAHLAKHGLSHDTNRRYVESLEKLKKRTVDIFIGVHPSDNDTFAKWERMKDGGNPFINRMDWPAFLSKLEANAKKVFGMANQST